MVSLKLGSMIGQRLLEVYVALVLIKHSGIIPSYIKNE